MIYKETITEKMYEVAETIFNKLDNNFYIAGGTALSLQIGHRKSIDLDYFIKLDIDTIKLKTQIIEIFKDKEVEFTYEEKNTLWCIIDGVKVSFISRFDVLINNITENDCFRLASIQDILVMKLLAICSREEYKDYFDLACLSDVLDVKDWNEYWLGVYKNSDPISYIIALASVSSIPTIPLIIMDKYKNISPKEIIPNVVLKIKKYLFS